MSNQLIPYAGALVPPPKKPQVTKRKINGLTHVECEILLYTSRGYSPALIAAKMQSTTAAVTAHIQRLRNRFNCLNTTHLVAEMLRRGLIP